MDLEPTVSPTPAVRPDATTLPRRVSLALQGGGAFGAYTWGVIDQLLGRRDLEIAAISGTSAGAMNGAILCSELALGHGRRARETLESFWHSVAESPGLELMRSMMGPVGAMMGRRLTDWWSPGGLSPYKVDPLDLNPLRAAIEAHVDIEAIRSGRGPELFVTATNVRTGLPRIFAARDLSIEALMASACLPQLFRPVEIDGEFYWDGGYAGNPTLWPLIQLGGAEDLILVQLTPDSHERVPRDARAIQERVPRDARAIQERVTDLVFHSSLVAEMQAIHTMRELVQKTQPDSAIARLRLHRIGPPQAAEDTKGALDRSWSALKALRDEGQAATVRFFRRHGAALGERSTLDIARVYLDPRKPRVRAGTGAAAGPTRATPARRTVLSGPA